MDYTSPVARRTRANHDRVYREMFERNKKKDIKGEEERDSDFEIINGGSDSNHVANQGKVYREMFETNQRNKRKKEIKREEEEEEEEEEKDSDFEIINGGSDSHDKPKRRRFAGPEENKNLSNGETSGRGSERTRGTPENPICIIGEDDDGDDEDSEELELSSESSDRSSDETYEVEQDEETSDRGGRKNREEREVSGNGKEGGESDRYSHESESESDSDDGLWLLKGSDEEEEEAEKKNKRERREEKRPRGSPENDSDSDSDDPGFRMLSEPNEDNEEKKKKEEKEKTNVKKPSPIATEPEEMDISSSENSDKSYSTSKRITRSQSSKGNGRGEKKTAGPGTASSPISFIEEHESESESESDEERLRMPAKRTREARKASGKGRKRRGGKGFDIIRILLDSMSENGEGLGLGEKGEESEIALPLKFTFADKEPEMPEKSDYEKELNRLWSDFHISLASEEIGSSASKEVECESELDEDALCQMGKHERHILDEQIGIICQNCSAVILEIQYVMPSFDQNPSGRSDFRDLERGDYASLFDELGHQEPDLEALSVSELRARAETVWDVIPGVQNDLYEHQREGFEFIWKHVAGGIRREHFENLESSSGGRGCIISHAPGTGKSRLALVFLQAYMRLHPRALPVIIAPSSMLLTWEEEFKKWKIGVPFHNLNAPALSGKEDGPAVSVLRQAGGAKDCSAVRTVKLYSWEKGGGVLGVSYSTFEKMAGAQRDETGERIRRFLLDLPGLVVLDEGHIPRNKHSLIWQALSRLKTPRRVLLSGTPFQNNFSELYNTMRVVNPTFWERAIPATPGPGGRVESQTKARRDWIALTNPLGKDADAKTEAARLKRIKSFIDPFVHIHCGAVLEKSLKGLRESIVVLRPSALQKTLLQGITATRKEQLQLERAVSLISVHPSLARSLGPETLPRRSAELESLRSNPNAGVKTKFLIGLIRLCRAINERVLVFSQYLDPLTLVMEHLEAEFGWSEGSEVVYIDGQREMKERQGAINKFNDPSSEARVSLVSIRAGGEGISLVGASRVVLLDVVWNPSVEWQAMCRAYRLGQTRFVYAYHLVASGTIEEDKYSRQAAKDRMSKLVFSSSAASSASFCEGNRAPKTALEVAEDRVLDAMVRHERLEGIFESVSVKNKDSNLVDDRAAAASELIFEREV